MRRKPAGTATTYRGARMRSRLEARWAATFDQLGWTWEYEPTVELERYIPDFIIDLPPPHEPTLVECKPFVSLVGREVAPARTKIERSTWLGPALVVGARIFPGDVIGWHRASPIGAWTQAHVTFVDGTPTVYRGPLSPDQARPGVLLMTAWRAAGNIVQWKAPR